jgi:hypothetical protein
MSRLIRLWPHARTAKTRRRVRTLHESCTRARLADRELMSLRTNLTRQCGAGCYSPGSV